jgi:hypothetical protein
MALYPRRYKPSNKYVFTDNTTVRGKKLVRIKKVADIVKYFKNLVAQDSLDTAVIMPFCVFIASISRPGHS